eukprot:273636-Chlamydomonas_euryale.AAC.4
MVLRAKCCKCVGFECVQPPLSVPSAAGRACHRIKTRSALLAVKGIAAERMAQTPISHCPEARQGPRFDPVHRIMAT